MHKHNDTQFWHTILHTLWHPQWLSHTYTMQHTFTHVNKLLYRFIPVFKPNSKIWTAVKLLMVIYRCTNLIMFFSLFFLSLLCFYLCHRVHIFSIFLVLGHHFFSEYSVMTMFKYFFWVFDSILQNWDELVDKKNILIST